MVRCTYERVTGNNFQNKDVLQSLKVVFELAKSADHEEMSNDAAFYLDLNCCHTIRLGVPSIQRVNKLENSKLVINVFLNSTYSFNKDFNINAQFYTI